MYLADVVTHHSRPQFVMRSFAVLRRPDVQAGIGENPAPGPPLALMSFRMR
jgi:hypothetical protein